MTAQKKRFSSEFKFIALILAVAGLTAASVAMATELAKVNDRTITDKDLKGALSGLNEGQKASVLKDANSRKQILNSLIEQELLVSEALKEKLDQDQEYKDAMEAFRKQYLANRLLHKHLSAKFTDSAVKKYYDAHKTRYSTDQVHAMHILVDDEAKAKEIMKEVKAPGANFQALAEKYSKDPSAKNNRGDLGFFGRDRMVPEFTEAAFAGDENEIVGPVKTAYGYHIIKVLEKKAGKAMDFDDVEVRVRNELRQDLTEQYVGGLRKSAKIKVSGEIDKM